MAPYGLDGCSRDAVLPAELYEMASQSRALALPAAHTDVDVVALREHPAVAAGDRAELEDGASPIPVLADRLERHVALERDGEHVVVAEPEPVANPPVDPVRADERAALDPPAVDAQGDAGLAGLDLRHLHAVTDVRAGGDGLLEQMLVEADALRHLDQRPLAVPFEAHPVAEAKADAVDDVLDHRVDRDRQLADGAHRQPAAARLVPREARLVDDEHPRSRAGQMDGGYRARRPGADDDRVEALHAKDRRPARLDFPARGCARAAKGSGL